MAANLTRVGAVLGTPLYMSPEQCRGEKLSRQSDIYSLGVIAYQMLSGKTPFSGDYLAVMEAHKETAPPPLEAKRIPKKTKQVVASALAKNIEERPPTALAFASELRAQSEGFGALYPPRIGNLQRTSAEISRLINSTLSADCFADDCPIDSGFFVGQRGD